MTTKRLKDFYQIFWNFPEKYADKFGKFGDIVQITNPAIFGIYCIALTAYQYFVNNILDYQLLLVFVCTYLATLIIQITLKFLFNNPRPRTEISENNNQGVNLDLNFDPSLDGGNSFPSGHTMSAMTGGMFWFQMTFGVPEIGIACGIVGFTLALLTAFSRIIKRAHWVRDVGFSAIVSICAYFIGIYFL